MFTLTLISWLASISPLENGATLPLATILQLPTEFDFQGLGLLIAGVSFGLIGIIMAGAAFFGDQAERAKRTWLPTTISGLVLIGIGGAIIEFLS